MAALSRFILVLPFLGGAAGMALPVDVPTERAQQIQMFDAAVADYRAACEALALAGGVPGSSAEPLELRLRYLEQMWALAEAGHAPALAWILRHFALDPLDPRDPAQVKLELYRSLLPACAAEPWLAERELDVLTSLEADLPVLGSRTTSALAHDVFLGVAPRDTERRLRALKLEAGALAPLGEAEPFKVRAACEVWMRELAQPERGPLRKACEDALWRLHNLAVGRAVPDFVTADVDGNEIRLSDFRGKVVVVAFFSLARADQRAWTAELRTLTQRLEGAPFTILGVDQDTYPAQFRRQFEERELRFPCAFEGGPQGRVTGTWHIDDAPWCLVLDREGRLRHVDLRGNALEGAIRTLVREPVSQSVSGWSPPSQPDH